MHELMATQAVLDAATARARAARGESARLREVQLELGSLSGLTEDSIRFYWEMLTPGTSAEGCALAVSIVPGRVRCRSCGRDEPATESIAICPVCGSFDAAIAGGGDVAIVGLATDGGPETHAPPIPVVVLPHGHEHPDPIASGRAGGAPGEVPIGRP